MDLKNLDLERLKADVADSLSDALADLLEGAQADLQLYAESISRDALEAHLTGQEEIQGQLLDQLKLLAEIHRIRVENHAWTVVASVTRAVFRAALAGALSVLL